MGKILVSGLINVETSLKVERFPIDYSPIDYPFFGVSTCVSGVGYNVAKALKTLGSEIDFLSVIGDDENGQFILNRLSKDRIPTENCRVFEGKETAESVVLVDNEGRRKIYCDLKDIQGREPLQADPNTFENCDLAILTNINFNRALLQEAKRKGILVATDVHVLTDIRDGYNKDFLEAADILFLSNEGILGREGDFLKEIYHAYRTPTIVCGCGKEGALLYLGEEDRFLYEKAVAPKGVKSTVGAGDALFSCFLHFFHKDESLADCLRKAVLFAGIKIASSGGSNGFADEATINSFF